MSYNNGDIIHASAANNPWVHHLGVVVLQEGIPYIVHNTPMKQNRYGGNIVFETIDQFVSDGRKIFKTVPSDIEPDDIACWVDRFRSRPFDPYNWNCEQFVYWLLDCKQHSPQTIVLLAGGTAACLLLIKLW